MFKRYKNGADVLAQFERRIYHSNYDCKSMRKDYEEEVVWPNTGIFADQVVKRNEYFISQDYLDRLGMRLCSECGRRRRRKLILTSNAQNRQRNGSISSNQSLQPTAAATVVSWNTMSLGAAAAASLVVRRHGVEGCGRVARQSGSRWKGSRL